MRNQKRNPTRLCNHCGGDLDIRNPKGFCDHMYYPEYCLPCQIGVDYTKAPEWLSICWKGKMVEINSALKIRNQITKKMDEQYETKKTKRHSKTR